MSAPLREFVRDLPDSPGIYKFLNADDKLIYVGKAKSLKKRVTSYFNKDSGHNQKTRKLIRPISLGVMFAKRGWVELEVCDEKNKTHKLKPLPLIVSM